ncbi:hypothetical protein [Bradyrhizobium lablabi]|uniref:hypothetical protein n=1 Tax=Bradyrhizobium lablabi TaxID=722472 RepID=UPI001BAA9911|nr:hypothetical protein [Bradyrhizobium lablabi]MBR0694998.1 hypothetical protein [Bradyrhizobium lablabi]
MAIPWAMAFSGRCRYARRGSSIQARNRHGCAARPSLICLTAQAHGLKIFRFAFDQISYPVPIRNVSGIPDRAVKPGDDGPKYPAAALDNYFKYKIIFVIGSPEQCRQANPSGRRS